MNTKRAKHFLGLAAIAVVAFGTYSAVDGFAHGVVGMGNNGNRGMMGPGMMHGQQGYGPQNMMGGQQGYGPQNMMRGQQGFGPQNMMGGQQGYGPQNMMGGQQGYGRHMGVISPVFTGTDSATTTEYLQTLKKKLNVTKQQEPAWSEFSKATQAQTTSHNDMLSTMHGATAQESGDITTQHLQVMQQAITKHQDVLSTFQTLYGQLDPTQKTLINNETAGCPGWQTAAK